MIGSQILNYKIVSLIGDGGMGTVYLAEHVKLSRRAAIKMLHPHLASNEAIRMRFENEAKTMSDLLHPNIVRLSDYHEDSSGLYLIMEYIEGRPLDDYIKNVSGPIPEEIAIQYFSQALEAFQYAHDKGIVHRDIKPSNLILTNDGRLKVLDFGIAKLLGNQSYSLTKTGSLTGTVYYMSPEQVRGQDLDHRSDIYSLGITLYQMVTGFNPYYNLTTEYDIYDKIVNVPLSDPRLIYPAVSEHISKVIRKATQKNPNDRFQSCNEFLNALNSSGSLDIKEFDSSQLKDTRSYQSDNRSKLSKLLMWIIPVSIILIAVGIYAIYANYFKNNLSKNDKDSTSISSLDSSQNILIDHKEKDHTAPTNNNKKDNDIVVKVDKKQQKPDPTIVPNGNGIIKLEVKGNSLKDFESKIKLRSNKLMVGKGYMPENIIFNLNNYYFSCDLVPQNTSYTKIGLYYAPLSEGYCVSCANVISKNPGSVMIGNHSDNSYFYQFIVISE